MERIGSYLSGRLFASPWLPSRMYLLMPNEKRCCSNANLSMLVDGLLLYAHGGEKKRFTPT